MRERFVLTCGLILNLKSYKGVMLIIFFGLTLRPYVVLYPWVDTGVPIVINIVGAER